MQQSDPLGPILGARYFKSLSLSILLTSRYRYLFFITSLRVGSLALDGFWSPRSFTGLLIRQHNCWQSGSLWSDQVGHGNAKLDTASRSNPSIKNQSYIQIRQNHGSDLDRICQIYTISTSARQKSSPLPPPTSWNMMPVSWSWGTSPPPHLAE